MESIKILPNFKLILIFVGVILLSTSAISYSQAIIFQHTLNGNLKVKQIDVDKKNFIILGDSTVCKGSSVEYTISTNESANWSNGTNGEIAIYTITGDTIIRALITNKFGCEYENVKNIIAIELPAKPEIVRVGDSLIVFNVSGNFEWYRNGQLFSVGLNYIRPDLDGEYTVKVFDSNGCENISDIYNLIISSTGYEVLISVAAYPNPTSGIIWLQNIDVLKDNYELSIYSTNGKEFPVLLNGNQLDITSFPNGIFILKFQSRTNIQSIRISKI